MWLISSDQYIHFQFTQATIPNPYIFQIESCLDPTCRNSKILYILDQFNMNTQKLLTSRTGFMRIVLRQNVSDVIVQSNAIVESNWFLSKNPNTQIVDTSSNETCDSHTSSGLYRDAGCEQYAAESESSWNTFCVDDNLLYETCNICPCACGSICRNESKIVQVYDYSDLVFRIDAATTAINNQINTYIDVAQSSISNIFMVNTLSATQKRVSFSVLVDTQQQNLYVQSLLSVGGIITMLNSATKNTLLVKNIRIASKYTPDLNIHAVTFYVILNIALTDISPQIIDNIQLGTSISLDIPIERISKLVSSNKPSVSRRLLGMEASFSVTSESELANMQIMSTVSVSFINNVISTASSNQISVTSMTVEILGPTILTPEPKSKGTSIIIPVAIGIVCFFLIMAALVFIYFKKYRVKKTVATVPIKTGQSTFDLCETCHYRRV
jgi:hypothetical protein